MITQTITARNYAKERANRIHSDETAHQYGFRGALVPGVGIYSYLITPVISTFGDGWVSRGAASVKFLKPVYDGDEVTVRATQGEASSTLTLELFDPLGTLCAVGTATNPGSNEPLQFEPYPYSALPDPDNRRQAIAEALPPGAVLGSLEVTVDLNSMAGDFDESVRHPAFLLAQANEVLARNVALGPWIHTGSSINHHDIAHHGEALTLRSRVVDSGQKRGHDFVTIDIAVLGVEGRPIASIQHSALIRLREAPLSGQS